MAEGKPRWPLIATATNRSADVTKDARLINGYAEKDEMGEPHVVKRPGYTTVNTVTAGAGRGLYLSGGDIINIVAANFYRNTVLVGLVNAGGLVYTFTDTNYSSPFFVKNDLSAYNYDGASAVSPVVDVDYPALTVHGAAYLDGTTYVMTPAGNVRGSVISNPTSWDPLNTIEAQADAGEGVAIFRLLNLVVAMKKFNTQFFYNAGNPTGSPLSRYESPGIGIGCYSGLSVQIAEDKLFWVGQTRAGAHMVMMFDKLKPIEIGTPAINRLFVAQGQLSISSWLMRVAGHLFYGIKLSTPAITIVYDADEKLWYQWAGTDEGAWPIVGASIGGTLPIVQHESNGKVFLVNPDTTTDDAALFSWDLYTPNYDGGVRTKKYLHRMDFVGDQQAGSWLQVRHNESDYKTDKWSNFRKVDLSGQVPNLREEGTFYRRAYHFHHRMATPLRLNSVELDIHPCFF